MVKQLLKIEFNPDRTLQDQIKEHLIDLILKGFLPISDPLPSTRSLSKQLGVSRNTILLIYEGMVDGGYLISEPRRGYFVAPLYHQSEQLCNNLEHEGLSPPVWSERYIKQPSNDLNIIKPNNWRDFEFPFIYGQIQDEYFPMKEWRACSRLALSGKDAKNWIHDKIDSDDAMLVEQIRTRLLPRRGIYAEPSEILITIGTQNSLYLIANLLCGASTKVAIENPGFRDAYNIFSLFDSDIHLQPVDDDGVIVDDRLNRCDYLYLTPSHQVPTGAILTQDRRMALLEKARAHDLILIEDDYDSELHMQYNTMPAIKANDSDQRVIYIGSFSKAVSPGIRLGYMVADEELIGEMRALRRLMYRHTPTNNQRQAALFLAQGHYDAYLRKVRELYSYKENKLHVSVDRYLPSLKRTGGPNGATSIWLEAREDINTETLAWQASRESVFLEPGSQHFLSHNAPQNFLRLGFSAIDAHKIEPGIQALARVLSRYDSV